MLKAVIDTYIFGAIFLFLVTILGTTQSHAQTLFDRLDRNSDGRLSRQEFRGPPRAFKHLDGNNDGYISREEAAGTPLTGGERRSNGRQAPSKNATGKLLYVDTHNHLVGRLGMGATRQFDYDSPAKVALAAMDAAGVKVNLVMPMPQGVDQKYRLYLDDILPVVKKYPGRFAVLGGGGSLNVMIQKAVKSGEVTDALKKEFDGTAAELIKKGVVGFGEMAAEHFSMSPDHPYISAPPDHPLFLHLADLAASYDVPIDIHMEAIFDEMPLPSRFQSPPNPRRLQPNIARFERLLDYNRKAKIVWVHLGWDNTGQRTVDMTRALLSKHPNLYMSIRVASSMQARHVVLPTFPLDSESRLKPEWTAMFQEFSDRFLIGSDEIVQQGNRHPSAGSIEATVSMLRQLEPDLQRKIGYENAYRLYKLERSQ